jgi:1-aminocyclopropane-1-carboxylate synthase
VHHVYALSKDFCASGFRIGTLYTKNQRLLSCVANLNIFSCVSQPMQIIIQDLLTDDNFTYGFLEQSRQRTRCNYELCASRLDQMVIPYTPVKAGIFVYADFSSLLPEQTANGEARFSKLLVDAARIVMTPGQAQLDRKPGMFRICYAFVPPEVLQIAMQRLDKIVAKIRRCQDWDNLNAESLSDTVI